MKCSRWGSSMEYLAVSCGCENEEPDARTVTLGLLSNLRGCGWRTLRVPFGGATLGPASGSQDRGG
jgi:hypothetical protein